MIIGGVEGWWQSRAGDYRPLEKVVRGEVSVIPKALKKIEAAQEKDKRA